MKTFKISFVLFAVFAFLLTACGSSPSDEPLSPRLQEIKNSGQLVIGTALTAPFEFRDAQSGELKGLDVEIAEALASKLGVKVVWKEMAFADLIPTLQEGKVDMVIAGMYITDARKELVNMSRGYVETGLVAVGLASAPSFTSTKDFENKFVCVKTGSTGAKYAQQLVEEGISLQLREYADTPSSLEDVSKGYCDAALNDKINSIEYIKVHSDLKVASDVFQPAQIGAAVKTGDAELLAFIDATLQSMKADGSMDALYNTWVLGK